MRWETEGEREEGVGDGGDYSGDRGARKERGGSKEINAVCV